MTLQQLLNMREWITRDHFAAFCDYYGTPYRVQKRYDNAEYYDKTLKRWIYTQYNIEEFVINRKYVRLY